MEESGRKLDEGEYHTKSGKSDYYKGEYCTKTGKSKSSKGRDEEYYNYEGGVIISALMTALTGNIMRENIMITK